MENPDLRYDVAVGWACYVCCPMCDVTPCVGRFECNVIADYVAEHHPEVKEGEHDGQA